MSRFGDSQTTATMSSVGNDHAAIMAQLRETRHGRGWNRTVNQMPPAVVVAELQEKRANSRGRISTLRDRLLRVLLRENCPELQVPWYEHDTEGAGTLEEIIGVDAEVSKSHHDSSKRREPPADKTPARRESDTASASRPLSEDDNVEIGGVQTVKAMVHQPEVPATPAGGNASSTPQVNVPVVPAVLNAGGRSALNITNASERTPRNADVRERGRLGLPLVPAWEYYSERVYRKMSTAKALRDAGTAMTPQCHVSPATRQVHRPEKTKPANQRGWYTPAQDWEEIQRMPGSREVSDAADSSDSDVVFDRESRRSSRTERSVKRESSTTYRPMDETWREGGHRDSASRTKPARDTSVRSGRVSSNHVERGYYDGEPDRGVKQRPRGERRHSEKDRRRETRRSERKPSRVGRRLTVSSSSDSEEEVERKEPARRREREKRRGRRERSRTISSRSSSGSGEDWGEGRRASRRRPRDSEPESRRDSPAKSWKVAAKRSQAMKSVKNWGMKFSGEDKEDPEEFLEQLQDCRECAALHDRDLLSALPCALTKRAGRWYRTLKKEILSWSEFKKAFRHQFVTEYDREDLIDDLRRRTQAKGEKIAAFLSNFNYIVSRFKRPPSERYLVDTAYRNLLPEYRKAMADKLVESLEDLEKYGRRWERQKDLDSRYTPPPPPEKMRVPGAAFVGGTGRHKAVAALEKDGEAETPSPKPAKNERKAAKKAGKNGGYPSSRSSDGESRVVSAKVVERGETSGEADEAKTYAAALQGGQRPPGAPGNQYGPGRGYGNDAWRGATPSGQAPETWRTGLPRGSYGRPGGANQPPGGGVDEKPFLGVCNLCQAVGHRASVCPDVICFWCRQKGHTMRNCQTRNQPPVASSESCQVCNAPNTTFKACSRCAPLREKWGNGQAGGQAK